MDFCCLSVLNATAFDYNLYVGARIRWVSVHFLYYFDNLSFLVYCFCVVLGVQCMRHTCAHGGQRTALAAIL